MGLQNIRDNHKAVLLQLRNLTKRFGGLIAVADLSFDICAGEIVGLIGPNGAGKTTLLNVLSGIYAPSTGKVIFDGKDVTGWKLHMTASKGLVRTFQANELFRNETVLESMMMAHHLHSGIGFFGRLFKGVPHVSSIREEEKRTRQKSLEILKYMGLDQLRDEIAGSLPHGYQRLLGLSMALATKPKLLLSDEPVTGMNPEETKTAIRLIEGLRERGITMIVVEHNMRAIMALSDRIIVMNYGRKIAEGTPDKVRQNKDVIDAYLGAEEDVT